jgi:hypothetical protein
MSKFIKDAVTWAQLHPAGVIWVRHERKETSRAFPLVHSVTLSYGLAIGIHRVVVLFSMDMQIVLLHMLSICCE